MVTELTLLVSLQQVILLRYNDSIIIKAETELFIFKGFEGVATGVTLGAYR